MWSKSKSLNLSRVMTWAFLALLTAACVTLPTLLRWYMSVTGKGVESYAPLMYALWGCAIPAFIALICIDRLLRNIKAGEVFVEINTRLIRIVSWCCFFVSAVMGIFCLYNVFGALVSIVAAFIGLILRVVKNVIAQAIVIKAENDLTV